MKLNIFEEIMSIEQSSLIVNESYFKIKLFQFQTKYISSALTFFCFEAIFQQQ
jgi:hypothetical protein